MANLSSTAPVKIRVGLINTYLQGREVLIPTGDYPAHHLWGVDQLSNDRFEIIVIPPSGSSIVNRFARLMTRMMRFRFGDLDQEIEIWKRRDQIDIAYVANGNLFWLFLLHVLGFFRPKIVRWVYVPRPRFPWWSLRELNLPIFNRGTDLLLCLTYRAAEAYRKEMSWQKLIQVDWGADINQFRPGQREGNFFFACGKTNRDYAPILTAAASIQAPIHLIVHPGFLVGKKISPNVKVAQGSPDGITDRGISYPDLLSNYFHHALAMLIPLKSIHDDTAGMTNLLEAMACGLPVIMTRTGAIDIHLEREGIGIYVDPDDPSGWECACNWMLRNPHQARQMGDKGRHLAETWYNTNRLGSQLEIAFIDVLS
ncbi:MAG: glycosyltransferase [Cyanobacteriota bacterium]|jgi:glycosyltransferase involved in cell wall biosynthesis